MRVMPIVKNFNNFSNSNADKAKLKFKNDINSAPSRAAHQYSGVASADLAYASMFDDSIARDLKLMGLI